MSFEGRNIVGKSKLNEDVELSLPSSPLYRPSHQRVTTNHITPCGAYWACIICSGSIVILLVSQLYHSIRTTYKYPSHLSLASLVLLLFLYLLVLHFISPLHRNTSWLWAFYYYFFFSSHLHCSITYIFFILLYYARLLKNIILFFEAVHSLSIRPGLFWLCCHAYQHTHTIHNAQRTTNNNSNNDITDTHSTQHKHRQAYI